MRDYRVVSDTFQIGSTSYIKGSIIPLPEVAGEFGIANGSLKPARKGRAKAKVETEVEVSTVDPGEFARRDMEAKPRTGKYGRARQPESEE